MPKLLQQVILLAVGISCVGSTLMAETDAQPLLPETNAAKSQQGQFQLPDTTLQRTYCPTVDLLQKDPRTQIWSGEGGWKANAPSFLNTLTVFIGAQWVGVSVGEIICLYAKAGRADFPVALQRNKLVPAPEAGGLWSSDKGGYMECKAEDVHSCPFYTSVPNPPKDIYEQLDFYKGRPTEKD